MTDRDGMIRVPVDANRDVLVLGPATMECERTIHIEVPRQFLAAGCGPASRGGEHVLVALATGEIFKIHAGRAEFVFGDIQAGSEMPEMLLHLRG